MSKEELLKYLIAEIDLIMHDKDYRFENANGTWYSRESCRDLTNEEVFEELRTELRQFADLESKLAESEKKAYSRGHSQRDIANEIKLNALREDVANKEKRIVELKQQLEEKEKERHEEWKTGKEWKWEWQKVNQKLEKSEQDKISFAVDILEELADCSNYINSKLGFESGSYVSEKSIRDKIKYLKGNKYE